MNDIKAEIQAANDRLTAAFNRGDLAEVAALYTGDAILLPPAAPRTQGRDAIHDFWQAGMESGIHDLKLTAGDVERVGEKVCEIGRYTLRVRVSDTETVDDHGKYVVIWKQIGGQWHLHVDIWNSDLPG